MNIHELKSMSTPQLADLAESLGIENAHNTRRSRLTSKIIEKKLETGENITATGILEASGDFGFLRDPLDNFLPGDEDIYIPPALIRRNNLRTGDEIEVEIRPPAPQEVRQKDGRPKEDKLAAGRVISIHGQAPESNRNIPQFEDLTPLHPNRLMRLERPIKADENITGRLIDLFAPIGLMARDPFAQRLAAQGIGIADFIILKRVRCRLTRQHWRFGARLPHFQMKDTPPLGCQPMGFAHHIHGNEGGYIPP
jgi:transcription termination factor Rho